MDRPLTRTLVVNGVAVDFGAERLRDGAGRDVALRPQSFAVLRYLADNAHRIVPKDELMQAVWRGIAVTDDSLVQCVHDIRRALRDHSQSVLRNVPRRGYQLVLPQPAAWSPRLAALTGCLLLALAVAAAWWWRAEPAPGRPPSIAVLPFDDMSADASLRYLGDGVADDIISMLARSPDVLVMARNSSFVFGGRPVDVREVGKRLGVDYVLEGSVRREADKLRVVAQLNDATTGEHLWAERFDKAGEDPWALQDDVAGRILNALAGETGQLRQAQFRAAWGRDTTNLGEYDYFLRGLDLYINAEDAEQNERAGRLWREGLEKYPDSALLKVKLGWYHWTAAWDYWSGDLPEHFREADRLVSEALASDNLAPEVRRVGYWLNAFVLMRRGEFERAVEEARWAVQMAPYDARVLRQLSDVLAAAGRYDMALEWLDTAQPREVGAAGKYHRQRGYLYRLMGRYDASAREYAAAAPLRVYHRLSLAIDYVRLGRMDEARAQVRAALRSDPEFTQALWRAGSFYSDPAILEGEVVDLARAGLPEN